MEVNWLVWCQKKNTPQNLILSLSCQLTAALGSDSQVLPIRRQTVCTILDRKYCMLHLNQLLMTKHGCAVEQ